MSFLLDHKPTIECCTALTRELEGIAVDARRILEKIPGRFKVDLHCKKGWRELQGALTSERFAKSLAADDMSALTACCTRWISRYQHLLYVASTRPVWNT